MTSPPRPHTRTQGTLTSVSLPGRVSPQLEPPSSPDTHTHKHIYAHPLTHSPQPNSLMPGTHSKVHTHMRVSPHLSPHLSSPRTPPPLPREPGGTGGSVGAEDGGRGGAGGGFTSRSFRMTASDAVNLVDRFMGIGWGEGGDEGTRLAGSEGEGGSKGAADAPPAPSPRNSGAIFTLPPPTAEEELVCERVPACYVPYASVYQPAMCRMRACPSSSKDMYNNDVGQESAQKFMKQTGALKAATLYFAS